MSNFLIKEITDHGKIIKTNKFEYIDIYENKIDFCIKRTKPFDPFSRVLD
jgi:hypothetical protein